VNTLLQPAALELAIGPSIPATRLLRGQPPAAACLRDDVFEERPGDVALEQSIPTLVKVVGVQTAPSHPQADKPAK
jgi:hypothetical protein